MMHRIWVTLSNPVLGVTRSVFLSLFHPKKVRSWLQRK
jgi:hypothetical protein